MRFEYANRLYIFAAKPDPETVQVSDNCIYLAPLPNAPNDQDEKFIAALDGMGKEGWEAFAVSPTRSGLSVFFKRAGPNESFVEFIWREARCNAVSVPGRMPPYCRT